MDEDHIKFDVNLSISNPVGMTAPKGRFKVGKKFTKIGPFIPERGGFKPDFFPHYIFFIASAFSNKVRQDITTYKK